MENKDKKLRNSILYICDSPKTPPQIIAELELEEIPISYPTLMQKLAILVAQGKILKVKRMDKKVVYHTRWVPLEVEEEADKYLEGAKNG